ncbi:MAG: glycosyltransferase family 4 protein [Planctomycetaceae bacterium]|nr:glycosyltransferase family 4 protein [Planctomycetaceae bacterium]
MIRLVHVTTVPQTATSFLSGQLGWLKQHGFEITVVTSPGAEMLEFADREGVTSHSLSMKRAISPGSDLVSLARLIRVFRGIDPHIVHAHTPKAGLLAMLAASCCRVPIRIYHLHGLRYESALGWKRTLLQSAEKVANRFATDVLCVSPSVKHQAVCDRLFPESAAKVLGKGSINGVDAQRFDPDREIILHRAAVRKRLGIPSQATVLGFVGRMVRDKGIAELVQVWRQLRDEFPELHLLLVGPFEEGGALPHALRAELKADRRVHLPGLDWNAIPYYTAMDLFTLPSYREGLPTVLLEAAAMRLPVVATRVTGCVDAVVEGHTGLLVSRGNVDQLANAIRRYVRDPELRRRHGLAARARIVNDFQPLAVWQSLYSHYLQLLDRKGNAGIHRAGLQLS